MNSDTTNGRPRRLRALWVLAGWLVPAASCATALALDQSELDANRTLWESHNVSDYDFIMSWQCRCAGGNLDTLLSVRGGMIASAVDALTLAPRNPQLYLTIDESFDTLQGALDDNSDEVLAEFDAQYGYPRDVFINFRFGNADEELSYTARDLVVVPEPANMTLALVALTLCCLLRAAGHRRGTVALGRGLIRQGQITAATTVGL